MSRGSLVAVLGTLLLAGCASIRLDGTDFGWPVESVLEVNAQNRITDDRYAVVVPVGPLAGAEFGDTTALRGATLRVLRSTAGFYYITGANFAHVYVFSPAEGALTEYGRVRVVPEDAARRGLRNPALNQRPPYIELLEDGVRTALLSGSDLVEPEDAAGGAR